MQIVIDIPESYYQALKADEDIFRRPPSHQLVCAILDGTPLPEGHADLNDADDHAKNIMIEDLVDEINNVIEVSIKHGGDYGGAYCCYPEEHKEAVESLAKMLDLEIDAIGSSGYAEDDPSRISHCLLSKRKRHHS